MPCFLIVLLWRNLLIASPNYAVDWVRSSLCLVLFFAFTSICKTRLFNVFLIKTVVTSLYSVFGMRLLILHTHPWPSAFGLLLALHFPDPCVPPHCVCTTTTFSPFEGFLALGRSGSGLTSYSSMPDNFANFLGNVLR